jgi:hypothetical protein
MAIREATTSVEDPTPAEPRPDRRRRRRDLRPGPFPAPGMEQWHDTEAALLQQETAEWVLEFQSNLLRLERSNTTRPGSVPLHGTAEP